MEVTAIAGAAMTDDQRRMESISHNIANVLTPAYKRQITISASFESQLAAGLGAPASMRSSQKPSGTLIDVSAGAMRPTGNANDVAIEGESFFELQSPTGPVFTRLGNLRVDNAGRLVGGQGLPVMGAGGEISLANAPFEIAPNGDVVQGGRTIGQLKRVRFAHGERMVAQGNGMYAQGGATVTEPNANDRLRTGMLEASNVSSPQEMVRLTETVRHFESLQKVVQGYDEIMEKAIRKLGDF
jgi:flagellar basal-body rod protein FlgF